MYAGNSGRKLGHLGRDEFRKPIKGVRGRRVVQIQNSISLPLQMIGKSSHAP